MSSVYERLRKIAEDQKQDTLPFSPELVEREGSLMGSIAEKEREGETASRVAHDFFRASGIKLILIEMNRDFLEGKGEIIPGGRTEYCVYGEKSALFYEAHLNFTWTRGFLVPINYSLIVSIHGNLLDEQRIGNTRLHRKTLSMDLMEKDSSQGYNAIFPKELFDINNPTGADLKDARTWTESNIVNFVSKKERLKGKSIL